MEDMKFCQSCGMPLTKTEDFGTEKDGKLSEDYCVYCYKDGAFTADCTMEEMIDFCAAPMVASNPGMEADASIFSPAQALALSRQERENG